MSSAMSNLADGIVKVALPLVAIRFTDSPTLIAGLAFALMIPWLLFALPAGALADRLDRRRAMVGANTVRAVLLAALVLTVITGIGSIWVLYAVAFCIGIAETIYDTSAQSIMPQLVSRDLLSRANARLFAAELTANEFVGPPLSGVLVAAGVALAFATPAALWVLAVAVLLLVPGTFRVEREQRTTIPDRLLGRVNSGYRLVAWGTRPLGAIAGGLLAQVLGLRAVFLIMALLVLTNVAGMTKVTNKSMDAAERDAEHPRT